MVEIREREKAIRSRLPCPIEGCNSSDAYAEYSDHGYCFSCGGTVQYGGPLYDEREAPSPAPSAKPKRGQIQAIPQRGLRNIQVLKRYGYEVDDEGNHLAPFFGPNGLVAVKVRTPDKQFYLQGEQTDRLPLFGQGLEAPHKSKTLVVTEGEIDCLTIASLRLEDTHCVSLPQGSNSAKSVLRQEAEWDYLTSWGTVILALDGDENGAEATETLAMALSTSGQEVAVRRVRWPEGYKDANDIEVRAGPEHDLKGLIKDASPWRPDGIHAARDLLHLLLEEDKPGLKPMFSCIEDKLKGYRPELWTIVAGTGIGKSTLASHLAWDLIANHNEPVGIMFLEENKKKTLQRLIGINIGQPLYQQANVIPKQEQVEEGKKLFTDDNCFVFDHFGSTDSADLLKRMAFLATGAGCRWIIFDHITMATTLGFDSDSSGLSERQMIDAITTRIRSQIVEGCGVGVIMVSHTRKATGGGEHADGSASVRISDIRGSGSIGQLSDAIISIEKYKDEDREVVDNMVQVNVLKNRWCGQTGFAGLLRYDEDRGLLVEEQGEPAEF